MHRDRESRCIVLRPVARRSAHTRVSAVRNVKATALYEVLLSW